MCWSLFYNIYDDYNHIINKDALNMNDVYIIINNSVSNNIDNINTIDVDDDIMIDIPIHNNGGHKFIRICIVIK